MEQQIDNHVIRKLERMLMLHNQIKRKKTGPPERIAQGLNISTTEVYYLIQQLMELNPSLRYNHKNATYFYSNGFPHHIAISIGVIHGKDPVQSLIEVTSVEPFTQNFLFT